MGQGLSCRERRESGLFSAVLNGELQVVEAMAEANPDALKETAGRRRLSPLHVSAATGQIEVLSLLLGMGITPDTLNRNKQTPLMFAAMHGKISCLNKLIEAGANILMFDSAHGRTCLHYAAYYGHSDCLQAILSAARSSPVADSWGYARFVNTRDGSGSTPLHLAARQGHAQCLHILLENGALVSASAGGYGYLGSTALHLAARSGSLDCIRELLAWGANRILLDYAGRIPYAIALKYKHKECAALLNPSSAEPLVWPSALKFISELNPEAKALLQQALMEANKEREKAIFKETTCSTSSPSQSKVQDDDNTSEASNGELCCICFDQVCTIEVRQCGHQMCAYCILALCCHRKPNSIIAQPAAPLCPFCRSTITQLVVAPSNTETDQGWESSPAKPRRSSRKSVSYTEDSSSFKSLPAIGSLGKLACRSSGKVAAECSRGVEKL